MIKTMAATLLTMMLMLIKPPALVVKSSDFNSDGHATLLGNGCNHFVNQLSFVLQP